MFTELYKAPEQVEAWRREATDETGVIPFGYPEIDRYLKRGGLRRGQSAALLGRAGVGKTAFGCNVVSRITAARTAVMFSSQEMVAAEVVNRLLAIRWGLPVATIEEEYRTKRELSTVTQALATYNDQFAPLTLYTKSRPSFQDLETMWVAAGEPPVIVQDFMDRMDQRGLYGSKKDKVEEVAWQFKVFARDHNVAMLTLVQTGRQPDDGGGRKDRGQFALTEADAMYGGESSFDVMLGIYRPGRNPDIYNPELAGGSASEERRYIRAQELSAKYGQDSIIQVLKNRGGEDNLAGHRLICHWDRMQMLSTTTMELAGDAMRVVPHGPVQ